MIKPIPIPTETTTFKKGVSMSEQLRKERLQVERSAIRERGEEGDTPRGRGRPRKVRAEGETLPRPAKKAKMQSNPSSQITDLMASILQMNFEPEQKIMFIDAIISKHKDTR